MTTPSDPTNMNPVPMPAPTGMPTDAEIRALAQQLTTMSTPDFTASALLKGTVISSNLTTQPSTASITLMGSTTQIDNVLIADNVTAVAGDVVNVTMQGSNIQITGRVAAGAGDNGGWITPMLGSGFAHNGDSGGSVQYRLIQDNGAAKVQWRGVASVTGSVTSVLSAALDTAYRPSAQRKLIAARGMGNGNSMLNIQVQFTTSGTVVLQGNTFTFPAHTHSLGTSATENAQHTHYLGYDGAGDYLGYSYEEGTQHAHDMGNSTGTSGSTALPDWVSFNGLEYFL
jgi:hypothetical protein